MPGWAGFLGGLETSELAGPGQEDPGKRRATNYPGYWRKQVSPGVEQLEGKT